MFVKFKVDWILFALVKSEICELNLLCREHDPVLVTLLFSRGKQGLYKHPSALWDSRAVSQPIYPWFGAENLKHK